KEGAGEALWVIPKNTYYETNLTASKSEKKLIFSSWRAVPQAVSICGSAYIEGKLLSRGSKNISSKLNLSYSVSKGSKSKWSHSFVTFHPWNFFAQISLIDLRGSPTSLKVIKDRIRSILAKEGVQETTRKIGGRSSTLDLDIIVEFLSMYEPKIVHHLDFDSIKKSDLTIKIQAEDSEDKSNRDDFKRQINFLKKSLGSRKRVFRMTHDEIDYLVELAIAGPGVVAMRSLRGLFDFHPEKIDNIYGKNNQKTEDGKILTKTYSNILWFSHVVSRSYFASTSSSLVITSWSKQKNSGRVGDWHRVLRYSVENHFQQVMDEYFFLISSDNFEDYGNRSESYQAHGKIKNLLLQISSALSVRTTSPQLKTRTKLATAGKENVRRHYIQAYVESSGNEEENGVKKEHLRDAFNSPFWPFVLVTTSVGQEGLDFHRYCRDIVHWNLPSSGVAFEQREGRIQRYMCKSVRDSILSHISWKKLIESPGAKKYRWNPWPAVMDIAHLEVASNKKSLKGLRPYWSFQDSNGVEARIRRMLYCHPFSKEALRYEGLKESLILYRLALGQPRHSDFLEKLSIQLRNSSDKDKKLELIRELNLDLRPK
ncbi:MAG: hypothetical protein K2Q18_10535, partial [Bdellovibrionales bacterium]|nr:hypothetical protein [Bdellovibrionales bacterium]